MAWTLLTPQQQRTLAALLPPAPTASARAAESSLIASVAPPGAAAAALPNLALQRLRTSTAFQTDVRQFQEDLRAGKLDPSWIESASAASRRRAAGEFDEDKERMRAEVWGIREVLGCDDDGDGDGDGGDGLV
jgi:hypothetical protein